MSNDNDAETDVDDLLEEQKNQDRHTTEPTTEPAADGPTLADAIEEAYSRIDAGEAAENSTIRDKNIAALLRGLEDAGELSGVLEDANAELGRDTNDAQVSRAETLRQLVRVGLREVRAELMDEAISARQSFQTSQIDDF